MAEIVEYYGRGRSVRFLRHLPNCLTGLRLAAAPALAFLLVTGADRAALGVFAFAGLSDAADGFLAKRFNMATQFGRYLDPAADKLLMLASFLALSALHVAPLWLTVLVIARDAAILLGIFLAHLLDLPVRVAPLMIGKVSTAVQLGYIALALLMLAFGLHWPTVERFAEDSAAFFTVASWLGYGWLGVRALLQRRRLPVPAVEGHG
ncbi:MAG TPA: CDP-alcohol phosphatidyltransferase family protein [Rhizomicrobium sp.]|jgi:cardiolipin synthase